MANRSLQHRFTMSSSKRLKAAPASALSLPICQCHQLQQGCTATGNNQPNSPKANTTAQNADDAGITCSGCHYFFHNRASKHTSEKGNVHGEQASEVDRRQDHYTSSCSSSNAKNSLKTNWEMTLRAFFSRDLPHQWAFPPAFRGFLLNSVKLCHVMMNTHWWERFLSPEPVPGPGRAHEHMLPSSHNRNWH